MTEWDERRLGDVLEVIIDHRGKTPKKLGGTDFTDDGVPVVSAIHIKDGRIRWGERERYVPAWMFDKWMPVHLRRNDVLLTSEAPLGEVAQVESDDDLVLSQRLFALRGNPNLLDSTFLRYFLQTSAGRNRLISRASGTTVVGIRQAELVKVLVPVPPLPEQRRIAAVLGSLDDLIETNRTIINQCRALAVSLLDAASVDGDVVAFEEIARQVRHPARSGSLTLGTPYLGLEHFGTDGAGLVGVGDASTVESNKSGFQAGDVLYGKLRPYFRKVDRPGFDGVCSTEIWVLRPNDGWGAATLHAVTARPQFTDFAMSGNTGTRMPRANWEHVSSMPVPVPPAHKREALDRQLDDLWSAVVGLSSENEDLARTRDELLPLLMSGRARVDERLEVA